MARKTIHREETHDDHPLERMVFFSDAVMAIAITLLVIELHIPEIKPPYTDAAFGQALVQLIPNFIGFIISFFVIGAFWAGHHRTFALTRHWHDRLAFPNLLFLFAIAAMPFFTAFQSEFPNSRIPVSLYCGWLCLTALFNLGIQRVVFAPPVLAPDADPTRIASIRRRGLAVTLGTATATVTALTAPWPVAGLLALMTMPMWRIMLEFLARHRATRSGTG